MVTLPPTTPTHGPCQQGACSRQVCDCTLKHKDHRSALIQHAVVEVIVKLARKCLAAFEAYVAPQGQYCDIALAHVLRVPTREKDRAFYLARICLSRASPRPHFSGELVDCVGKKVRPYAPKLISDLLVLIKVWDLLPGSVCRRESLRHAMSWRVPAWAPWRVLLGKTSTTMSPAFSVRSVPFSHLCRRPFSGHD